MNGRGPQDTNDMNAIFGGEHKTFEEWLESIQSNPLPSYHLPDGAVSLPEDFSEQVAPSGFSCTRDPHVAPSGFSRTPELADQTEGKSKEERKKESVAKMGRKTGLIDKLETLIAPQQYAGEDNRGTREARKKYPRYRMIFDRLREDLLKKKRDEFTEHNDEDANSLATAFVDNVLPVNIFKCDTPDGTQHKNRKDPTTNEFNCIGCKNRYAWGWSTKTKVIEVCESYNIPNPEAKFEEYDSCAIELQKKESRTCQRLTEVAKDLGMSAYVWISDPNILPVHSFGRKDGRFKRLKDEGRISDHHRNVYRDASHKTYEGGCAGFTPNKSDKDGCCTKTCISCHFAWIDEKNFQFFDQQTVQHESDYDLSQSDCEGIFHGFDNKRKRG